MTKATDNPAHTYHTYNEKTVSNLGLDRQHGHFKHIKTFGFFTSNPATAQDQSK